MGPYRLGKGLLKRSYCIAILFMTFEFIIATFSSVLQDTVTHQFQLNAIWGENRSG